MLLVRMFLPRVFVTEVRFRQQWQTLLVVVTGEGNLVAGQHDVGFGVLAQGDDTIHGFGGGLGVVDQLLYLLLLNQHMIIRLIFRGRRAHGAGRKRFVEVALARHQILLRLLTQLVQAREQFHILFRRWAGIRQNVNARGGSEPLADDDLGLLLH
jgi:hypothetical protein